MKKLFSFTAIALAIALLAGCAKWSPVVGPVEPDNAGTAVGKLNVFREKTGVLAKKLVDVQPTILVVYGLVAGESDTVSITQNPMVVNYVLKRGESYSLTLVAKNPGVSNDPLNWGTVAFSVPNADTFSVSVTLPACQENLDLKIPLVGSSVAATACTASVKCDAVTNGGAIGFSDAIGFLPGALDTVRLSCLLYVKYAWVVTVRIVLSDGRYYLGSATTPVIAPSVDYDLTIPLTLYDKNGTVVKMDIALGKVATVRVKVTGY